MARPENVQIEEPAEKVTRQLVSRTAAAVANREAIDGRRSWHTLRMGVPIADIVQSESKALPNLLALCLPVRSVMRPAAPISRMWARSLFYKDFITCDSGKQLAPRFGLILADLLIQGEVLHNRIAKHKACSFRCKGDRNHSCPLPQKPQLSLRSQSALSRKLSLPPPPYRKSSSSFHPPSFSLTSAVEPTHI